MTDKVLINMSVHIHPSPLKGKSLVPHPMQGVFLVTKVYPPEPRREQDRFYILNIAVKRKRWFG